MSIDAPPKASILVESMRDIGYTLETAIADIVDNSISAGASKIDVLVDAVSPEAKICIADNGRGMSKEALYEAMRFGSRNPRAPLRQRELGRFGLGLKTASFSQCRRLTVAASLEGKISVAVWDLDHIARTDSWSLQTPTELSGIPFAERLGIDGVLVLWESLDRAAEQHTTEAGRRLFISRMDDVRSHLELVFHRYLTGEPGLQRVAISINQTPLVAFDPFHSAHSATIRTAPEVIEVDGNKVEVTAFTLPHHRNVSSAEWDHYGGTAGYLKNQGFYLYRERRLIVHATWFGLARQTELTKLARVRLDISNAVDDAWHVDVRKASARPPLAVRQRLQRLIADLGMPSKRVFTHRGKKLYDSRLPIWERRQENNTIVYRVNDENPSVAAFASALSGSMRTAFARTLSAIGAALPMDALFADLAASPEAVLGDRLGPDDLRIVLSQTWDALLAQGVPADALAAMLRSVEPFRSNWELSEVLIDERLGGPANG